MRKIGAPEFVLTRLFVLYFEIFFRKIVYDLCNGLGKVYVLVTLYYCYIALPAQNHFQKQVKTEKLGNRAQNQPNNFISLEQCLWVLWIMGMRNRGNECAK